MKTELETLARRAVACKHWRWMPGMLLVTKADNRFRLVELDFDANGQWEWKGQHSPPLPDLSDPATVGCLLALVRDAHCDQQMFVETYAFLRNNWRCTGVSFSMQWDAPTEAAALVAALEGAP